MYVNSVHGCLEKVYKSGANQSHRSMIYGSASKRDRKACKSQTNKEIKTVNTIKRVFISANLRRWRSSLIVRSIDLSFPAPEENEYNTSYHTTQMSKVSDVATTCHRCNTKEQLYKAVYNNKPLGFDGNGDKEKVDLTIGEEHPE